MNPRRIITSAILALVMTAMAAVGSSAGIGLPSARSHLAHLASMPAFPAAYVVAVLGLGDGPHGLPNRFDVWMYLFTFLLSWVGICGVRVWWTFLERSSEQRFVQQSGTPSESTRPAGGKVP